MILAFYMFSLTSLYSTRSSYLCECAPAHGRSPEGTRYPSLALYRKPNFVVIALEGQEFTVPALTRGLIVLF